MHRVLIAVALTALAFGPLSALAAQRTFVRSTGNDTNPCSIASPCRSFAAAIAVTDTKGEVIVLDSAGYGFVTVTQPVSIISPPGVYAGLSVFGGQDGVTVNSAPTDKVVLRGLAINGQGGSRGIVITQAAVVHIEHCVISNMASDGIRIDGGTAVYLSNGIVRDNGASGVRVAGGNASVHVADTRIANNGFHGIFAEAGALAIDRSQIENNGVGAHGIIINPSAPSTVHAVVRDSLIAANSSAGIAAIADAAGESVFVTVERSTAWRNGGEGFQAATFSGGTANFVLTNSVSTENGGNGFSVSNAATASVNASTLARNVGKDLAQVGGTLRSFGNNALSGNGVGDIGGTVTVVGLQ